MELRTVRPGRAAAIAGWRKKERTEDTYYRARLGVIETQLATFRALLRLKAAEHHAQTQMGAEWRRKR